MSLPNHSDPIVAIATPPGKGGVGIVRFSFPNKDQFLSFLLAFTGKELVARKANLLRLVDSNGGPIDEGLALRFDAPSSFTGEHVFEFQGHGGQAVLQAVMEHAFSVAKRCDLPLRHATAGEFTQRAFLNDKLDLTQAEAVADLIDAGSSSAAKAAAASLSGVFSKQVNALADKIVHLRLLLEATLDFPEEEIEFLEKANAKGQLEDILNLHRHLLAGAQEGVKFRDGLRIVLAGKPNVGKSSLLNILCGEEVAIVTDVAGTTRDKIEQQLTLRGMPLVVIDTAGLRRTDDKVEAIGIEKTKQELTKADVILHIQAADEISLGEDVAIESAVPLFQELGVSVDPNTPVLTVVNKVDLLSASQRIPASAITVSAKQGLGIEHLKDQIFIQAGLNETPSHGFMARQRHIQALNRCGDHLELAAAFAQQDDRILDLFAEELRLAHDCLGEITGRMLPDDLLGLIFSRFCIGK